MHEKIKTSPKDIFLHLLAIVTLYVSAGSVLALLFQYINVYIPDPLEYDYYHLTSAYGTIRLSMSLLVVMFPVYVWTMRFLAKSYAEEPEKQNMRIRKWLLYFTLFAAALIIMGDLVSLINTFLNGELTMRFLLKILSVFLVAGSVLWYYHRDLKQRAVPVSFSYAVIGIVAAAVIAGFFIAGTPGEERLRRFDNERTSDLQTIQWQIVNYWQQKGELPAELALLEDDISGFTVPTDPETAAAYAYTVEEEHIFELCATFARPSLPETRGAAIPLRPEPAAIKGLDNWNHEAGYTCFERTIDPDLYPVRIAPEEAKR